MTKPDESKTMDAAEKLMVARNTSGLSLAKERWFLLAAIWLSPSQLHVRDKVNFRDVALATFGRPA
jgi:hypothetical protein